MSIELKLNNPNVYQNYVNCLYCPMSLFILHQNKQNNALIFILVFYFKVPLCPFQATWRVKKKQKIFLSGIVLIKHRVPLINKLCTGIHEREDITEYLFSKKRDQVLVLDIHISLLTIIPFLFNKSIVTIL